MNQTRVFSPSLSAWSVKPSSFRISMLIIKKLLGMLRKAELECSGGEAGSVAGGVVEVTG